MAQHNIDLTILNQPLGVAPSSDGVMGLFVKAIAVSTTFTLDTQYLLTKFDDLAALGIDAAYDTDNKLAVYQQVCEFYEEAGDGALLYLWGVNRSTNFADYVNNSTGTVFKNLIRQTSQTDPAQRVKMIGFAYDIPQSINTSSTGDFPDDVELTKAALKRTLASLFQEGFQLSAIVDCYNMKSTLTPSTITTQATKSQPTISASIAGSKQNGVSAIGAALGRFARITIGHGFGAVADGPVALTSAYLTNGVDIELVAGESMVAGQTYTVKGAAIKLTFQPTDTLVVGETYTVRSADIVYDSTTYHVGDTFTAVTGHTSFTTATTGYVDITYSVAETFVCSASPLVFTTATTGTVTLTNAATDISKLTGMFAGSDIDLLGQKQFMFLRWWFNHTGFYWNDGATCDLVTKPLSTQEFNRVGNAIAADALSYIIETMGSNVPINKSTGLVDTGYTGTKEQDFYNTYFVPKINSSDISDGSITFIGTPSGTQVKWTVTIKIVPSPTVGSAEGTIEFTYTL